VLVADRVEKRDEDVKAGLQRIGVFSEAFHNPGLLLWNDAGNT